MWLVRWWFVLVVAACFFYVITTYVLAAFRADRPEGLLRSALLELLTTAILLPLWPFWFLIGKSYSARKSAHSRPVVLVHGLAMTHTSWFWLGRRLAAVGIGPIFGFTYFSPQSVRRSAENLAIFIQHRIAKTGADRVDLVAHSLGGIIARYYLERLGGSSHVAHLITIGTPHRGTLLARFGLVPSGREMAADSVLFDQIGPLRASEEVRYTSIWSTHDAIIVPPASSSIAPAGEDVVFHGLGHLSLLTSKAVARVVEEKLRDAPPRQLLASSKNE
jgi:triacylglycerol esterase/lipase EstA (alpha/beta hydrolase family)